MTNLDLAEYGTRTRLTYAYIEYPMQAEPGAAPGAPVRPQVRLQEWKGVWRPEMEIVV